MTITELSVLVGAVVTALGALTALVRLRPDRDAVLITNAQGATTILNGLVQTLREEVDRLRKRELELEEEARRKDSRIVDLQIEIDVLRKLAGRRRHDGE